MTVMPDSIALTLPEEWEDIPLEEEEYRSYVQATLKQLEENSSLERGELRQFELLSALAYQAATTSRVLIASSFIGVEPTAAEDEEGVLLMANLIVSSFLREDMNTDVPLRAELMAEAFSKGLPSDDQSTTYSFIEPPSVCEIGGHKAAKILRLATTPLDNGREYKQFVQTYFVSVSEGDVVLILHCSTINFEFARSFSELFDSIAQTLVVFYPDDPTFAEEGAASSNIAEE